MVINMKESSLLRIEQLEQLLAATPKVEFCAASNGRFIFEALRLVKGFNRDL
jgi:hypothetical protein